VFPLPASRPAAPVPGGGQEVAAAGGIRLEDVPATRGLVDRGGADPPRALIAPFARGFHATSGRTRGGSSSRRAGPRRDGGNGSPACVTVTQAGRVLHDFPGSRSPPCRPG